MKHLPSSVDLSGGIPPEQFFIPLIPDRYALEAWRADEVGCHDHTISHNSWCAPTSLGMALLLRDGHAPSQDELFQAACDAGVYCWEDGAGWIGADHRKFAVFIREYGFESIFEEGLAPRDVAERLADGYSSFLRVSPAIRYSTYEEPPSQIGHVVFCFGYGTTKFGGRYFRINNCAGFASLNSQIDFRVSQTRMAQVFSGGATIFR